MNELIRWQLAAAKANQVETGRFIRLNEYTKAEFSPLFPLEPEAIEATPARAWPHWLVDVGLLALLAACGYAARLVHG